MRLIKTNFRFFCWLLSGLPMHFAGVSAGTAAAVAAAAAGVAGAVTKNKGAKQMGAGGSESTTQTSVKTLPKWLLNDAKAYLERQYNLSNKDYESYPGFYQQLAKEGQAAQAAQNDFFGSTAFRPAQQAEPQQFRNINDRAYNPLTAKPGEALPVALQNDAYNRLMRQQRDNPNFTPQVVDQRQYDAMKKQYGKLFTGMKDNFFVTDPSQYAQMLNVQRPQQQGLFEQYGGNLNGIGFLGR